VVLAVGKPCALRGGLRLLRQPPDNATAPASAAVIVCAIGQIYAARQVLRPVQEKTAEERQVRQMVMQRQAAQQKSPLRSVWKKNDFER